MGGALTKEARKQFFFEKKNQKTFDYQAQHCLKRGTNIARVFCFFFSKKKFFLTSLN